MTGWVSDYARGTHPLGQSIGTKRFVMIRAYMDDSGTHVDSPYCLVAGYWGGHGQWVKFEREWKKVLDKYKVPEFHAKTYWARDDKQERIGPYKGWDDVRRKNFLFSLLTVIGNHKIYPFAHGVSRSEWNKQIPTERQVFCGSSGRLQAPDNPMYMAFTTCILRTIRHCHPGVVMHFVLDSHRNTDAWATICYGELKHSMSNEDHAGARSLGDLTFADSKCALPLQAADLLAYEAYKYAIWADGDYTKKVRPSYMLALRKFISRDDFWLYDARRFSNLRKYGEKATAKSLNSDDE
ncbi:MAG: hypothetical protein DMG97_14435 [Acidobacteria bacterium]|nr:MAG: hypothetical protein DMG96_40615 [Acidobacteriota bacterium]PYV72055.1 MAG: hypothetical protein DMG97_14435 [Acidobacteriota bacterium]HEU0049152.1 DUF3800 domain-containing protein [Nitrososphaera sp.]